MPPKKATAAKQTKKAAAPASHASYKDMIKDAILSLKDRNGSSRQAIKKYILANNAINAPSTKVFDSQFNRTIKLGVEHGDFTQPKGPSGPVKLAKREAKPASTKAAPKKATATAKKDSGDEKETPAKKSTAKAKAAPEEKKTAKAPAKPKATATKAAKTTKPRAKKTNTVAPAVTEKATVTNTTKSGRVTKTRAKPEPAKRAAPKKATAKKASTTPKKKADAEAAAES